MVGGRGLEADSRPLLWGRAAQGQSQPQPGGTCRNFETACCCDLVCTQGTQGNPQPQRLRSSRALGTAWCLLQGGRGAQAPSQPQLGHSGRAAPRLSSNAPHREPLCSTNRARGSSTCSRESSGMGSSTKAGTQRACHSRAAFPRGSRGLPRSRCSQSLCRRHAPVHSSTPAGRCWVPRTLSARSARCSGFGATLA